MDFFFREEDGLVLLCQNNQTKQVLIEGVNPSALKILGYDEDDTLRGETFETLLNSTGVELLADYLEYDDELEDLLEILNKRRQLPMKTKSGAEVNIAFKIIRAESQDNHAWFRLLLLDTKNARQKASIQQALHDNFKGHEVLDDDTGLPNKASMIKDIELAQHYVSSRNIPASFVYVKLNGFESIKAHGNEYVGSALCHVANQMSLSLRIDDVVGRIGDDAIGVLLMGVTTDSAPVVVNRLRLSVVNDDSFSIDVPALKNIAINVGYANITSHLEVASLIEGCRKALDEHSGQETILVE